MYMYLSHHLHPCKLPELLQTSIIHNGCMKSAANMFDIRIFKSYYIIELTIKTAYRFPTCASFRGSENLKFSGEHVARPPSTLANVNGYFASTIPDHLIFCGYGPGAHSSSTIIERRMGFNSGVQFASSIYHLLLL